MKSIPVTPLTLEVARRIIWFEPPEDALARPARFMAYAMTYARHEDMRVIRGYVSDDDFREALDLAPPGSLIRARGPTGIRRWGVIPHHQCRCGKSWIALVSQRSARRRKHDGRREPRGWR